MDDDRARVVAALQVRVNSSRLPRKALLPIEGRAMFLRCWERLALCRELDAVVVATSLDPSNDLVEVLCERERIGCVRGGFTDLNVIDRLVEARERTNADALVRVTSDCPMIDPAVVGAVVARWRHDPSLDYVSNVRPGFRTWPDGLDTEVISWQCLLRLRGRIPQDYQEEPTRFVWEHPEGFRIVDVRAAFDLSHLRWVVDEAPDLAFVRWAWPHLPEGFCVGDVLALREHAPPEMKRRFP